MVYCSNCKEEVEADIDDANGFSCCTACGSVLDEAAFSADVTFTKGPGGESAVDGQRVSEGGVARGMGRIAGGRVYGHQFDSHEKSLARGRAEIGLLISQLNIRPREDTSEAAHRLYRLALQRNFTRGRRTNQVAAACLYIVCRQDEKPFMLIDFSDALQVNVFVLGSVFLQLAQLLRLHDLPVFQRPIDPSLYIHRFAGRLNIGNKTEEVAATSLQLIKSMKRDWMQTGRRPAGLCGAALFIALHIHGLQRTKHDVVRVVHVGVSTIANRLRELAGTETGLLTCTQLRDQGRYIDEQRQRLIEAPTAHPLALPWGNNGAAAAAGGDDDSPAPGCEHIGHGQPPTPAFAHGLCRGCYDDYLTRSGGVHGGADPPAFTKGRKKEAAAAARRQAEIDARQSGLLALTDGTDTRNGASQPEEDPEDVAAAMLTALGAGELADVAQALPPEEQRQLRSGAGTSGGVGQLLSGGVIGGTAASAPAAPPLRVNGSADATVAAAAAARSPPARSGGAANGSADATVAAAAAMRSAPALAQNGAATGGGGGGGSGNDGGDVAAENASAPTQGTGAANGVGGSGTNGAAGAAEAGSSGSRGRRFRPSAAALAAGARVAGSRRPPPSAIEDSSAPPAQRRRLGSDPAPDAAGRDGSAGAGPPAGAEATVDGGELQLALVPPASGNEGEEDAEPENDTFSDLDDAELDTFVLSHEEAQLKERVWTHLNADYLERMAAKEAANTIAEEHEAEREAIEAAAAAAGMGEVADAERDGEDGGEDGGAEGKRRGRGRPPAQPRKRGRGRPAGSKTKQRSEKQSDLGPADTPTEAALRMIEHRKLSAKINYNVLADLFSDDPQPQQEGNADDDAAEAEEEARPSAGRAARGIAAAAARRPASPAASPARGAQQRLATIMDDLPTASPGGARTSRFAPRPSSRPRRQAP